METEEDAVKVKEQFIKLTQLREQVEKVTAERDMLAQKLFAAQQQIKQL